MRKSTREVQKRTLFQFEEQTNKTRAQYEEDVNGSPDTDEEEDLFDSKPVSKSKKSKAAPQKKKNSDNVSASSLFGECSVVVVVGFFGNEIRMCRDNC